MEKLGIIIVIESGDLEQKTKLLIESIRTFGGAAKDSKIWAVKPRKGKYLQKETIKFLERHFVEYINIDLNKHWYLYGLANKIYASAYIEREYGQYYETLLFLDSDTIVIDEIDVDILEGKYDVAVRTTENDFFAVQGVGKLSDYWKMIYKACSVAEKQLWSVKTSVTGNEILAYFNSGVIFSNSKCHLFQKWLINFKQLTKDINAYHLGYMEFYLLEQAILSGTIISYFSKERIKLLDNDYNYPLPFQSLLQKTVKYSDVRIIHYFELLNSKYFEELSNFPANIFETLKHHLPIERHKDQPLKKYIKVFTYIVWRLKNKCLIICKEIYEQNIRASWNNNSH